MRKLISLFSIVRSFDSFWRCFRKENERLLAVRREDERVELEEEERIRSQVLNLLSEKEFQRQVNIEDEVKQMKNEARSWVNPTDLSREIERMLNEKHDYQFSIDLAGIKRTSAGQEILDKSQSNRVSMLPFDNQPKNVQRKPPGASKYEE